MPATFLTRTLSLATAAATVAVLAACTSSSPPVKSPTATHSAGIGNGLPAGVTPAPIPTHVPNDPAARRAVRMTACKATTAGWKAGGTVTNDGKQAADYTITVFFTTKSATVINTAQTHVTVPAGKTQNWTASKDFVATPGTLCVLSGVG
ncbi:hypothetical protein ACO2Q7_13465 [Rathayibacter sp. KR2-224]|uniref:hypothetical protein n=1 Tax=Rathayibacter sp. KR2-224 TaxID=3400913 RepID=UPI003C076717